MVDDLNENNASDVGRSTETTDVFRKKTDRDGVPIGQSWGETEG